MNVLDYLNIVNRYRVLIVAITLVAGVASYLIAKREEPRFSSGAEVLLVYQSVPSLLTNAPNPATFVTPERNAATQARLARLPAVAQRAVSIARVNGTTWEQLLHDSAVTADPVSDVVSFSVDARSPQRAKTLATAYARAFVAYATRLGSSPLRVASRHLDQQLAQLKANGQGGSTLAHEIVAKQDQVEAMLALQTPDARVVRVADSAIQLQPRPTRAVALGAAVGFLLALATALLLYFFDSRVRTLAEAEEILGVPGLGVIPASPRRYRQKVAILEDRHSVLSGPVAAARTNVDLARHGYGGSETLLVTTLTGRTPGVKPNVVANLAVAFARAGERVILVDLDLRQPTVASIFDLTPSLGAMEVFLGMADLDAALQEVPLRSRHPNRADSGNLGSLEFGGSLHVLPIAGVAANPTDILASASIGQLIAKLRDRAGLVLIDAPPFDDGSGTAALTKHVDAVVAVTALAQDRRAVLADSARQLATLPAAKLGCIAVGRQRGGKPARGVVRPAATPARSKLEALR
jgi:Mrp family chromosome partitioning ATPase